MNTKIWIIHISYKTSYFSINFFCCFKFTSEFKTTKEINTKIRSFIRDMDDSNFSVHIYNDISIEKGILNFASETNANLIGMPIRFAFVSDAKFKIPFSIEISL